MIVDAVYSEVRLPEWQGNPLIEALPKKQDIMEILPKLSVFPAHSEHDRQLPAFEREDYLSRLDQLRLPLPEYANCFKFIQRALCESYSVKSPFSPTTNHFLHYISSEKTAAIPRTGLFEPNATAMTVVGISGVGKSKMLSQVLGYFPQVIQHKTYGEKKLNLKQLVWIRVDCPSNSTVRGLCHAILDQIDHALEEPRTRPEATLDALMIQIEHRIRYVFLGALVVDEMQNISAAKSGGAELIINFLFSLVNRSGVPVVFCGNPEMLDWTQKRFRLARRAEAGGYISMGPIKKSVWPALMNALWPLQWTNVNTELSCELSEKLYELSAGLPSIAVRVYKAGQDLVMGTEDERITVAVIEEAFTTHCVLTEDELVALRIAKDTMRKNSMPSETMSVSAQKPGHVGPKRQSGGQKKATVAGDLTRPQHLEFAERIRALQVSVNIAREIQKPNEMRKAIGTESVIEDLRGSGIVLTETLKVLGM